MNRLALLGLMALLTACRSTQKNPNIFRFNQAQPAESLDPAFAKNQYNMWHVYQIYNRLVEFDSQQAPRPSLATSWEVSPDRLTYIFHLRPDVYFHPNPLFPGGTGRRLVASDVVYSFRRLLDEKTASPGAWVFHNRVDSLRAFEAPNDSTFVLRLQRPFNPILGILGMMYCSIVPHEVAEHWKADFRNHPCGTGPFISEYWDEGVVLTYRRNPAYWEFDEEGQRLPYLDGIKCLQVDSKATEFLLFLQKDLDLMNGIDAVFKDQVLNRQGELRETYRKAFRLQKHPYLNVEYLGILMDDSLTKIPALLQRKLRVALSLGFDRRKLITYIRNGIGKPAEYGMIPPGLLGYDTLTVQGHTYQPLRARQLLEEVQQEIGPVPEITLLCHDSYADRCTFILSQWQALGIRARLEIMQPSLLREQMSNGAASFFWATWIADYPDAESYLSLFYGPHTAPPNYTRFQDAAFNRLYDESLEEADPLRREQLIKTMNRLLIEETPVIPLFYDEVLHFVHNRVQGLETNTSNMINLKRVRLNQAAP